MKVLVTGCSGLLGRAVLKESAKRDWLVEGTAFSRPHGNLKVDLTDQEQVKDLFERTKPDYVVHCAAERRPDVVEKDFAAAELLNVEAVQHVCRAAQKHGSTVIYMSTDYVFDGTSPPYYTDSKPNPLNNYGKTKLLGEHVTIDSNAKNIVLRVPILYGPIEYLGESAVTVLFEKVKTTDAKCNMSNYERRYPAHVQDIAQVCVSLIEKSSDQGAATVSGIFQCSGPEMMTKYDMAVAMAEVFGLPTGHILPENGPAPGAALRPYDAKLDCKRLLDIGINLPTTSFLSAIKSCLQPFAL